MFLTPAIPTPPPVVATFKPKPKPPLACFIVPKLCAPPPVKPPEEVPIPGPLPVLGAGAAFLWGRQMRQRIREAGK